MSKINYVGQIIGTREIIKNYCDDEDWLKAGMKKPSSYERNNCYVLGKCLNCGAIKPVDIKLLKRNPPKRCSFCSNIGHHSSISSNTNQFVSYDSYAIINIQYKKEIVTVYIDLEDLEKCSNKYWRISKKRNKYYVVSGPKDSQIYLHQFVFGKAPKGYEIDHKDGNSLNNRKENLRYLTRQDNARNTRARLDCQIGIKGISQDKRTKKYTVDFCFNHKRYYFKPWTSLEEACWCRFVAEEYFSLELISNNPLFEQYNTLDLNIKNDIKLYVLSIIKNNEKSSV